MRNVFKTLCYLYIACFAWTAHAAEAPWYQVEVLVFANEDPSALSEEFWPADIDIQPISAAIDLRIARDNSGAYDAYERLPTSALLLNSEAQRLSRSGQYKPMFHAGWLQPISEQGHAKPIHIQAGDMLDNGMYELEGYLTIDRGRYLHFKPDLYHSRKLSAYQAQLLLKNTATEEPPVVSEILGDNAAPTATETTTEQQTLPSPNNLLNLPEFLTVQMKQGRRMRSQELHYLDHPLMGILVVIAPIEKRG